MITLIDGENYDVDDILNNSQCKCGRELNFEDYGSDGFGADCECGRTYGTCGATVTVIITNDFDREEDGG